MFVDINNYKIITINHIKFSTGNNSSAILVVILSGRRIMQTDLLKNSFFNIEI